MRAIRFAVAALVVALANPANAALVPYEGVGGGEGATTDVDPVGAGVRRSNNQVEVNSLSSCGFSIVAGRAVPTGCRDRSGAACVANQPCDLDRVPAGRCTLGDDPLCVWPAGAGFCTSDPNVGCESNVVPNDVCVTRGIGTCNLATNNAACRCQGSNSTAANYESEICDGGNSANGYCSDGDTELCDGDDCWAPSLSAGLCSYINISGSNPANCGRESGEAFSGLKSAFSNPPLSPTLQRKPGTGADLPQRRDPIVDLRVTQVYEMGNVEPGRGGIRKFSLLADSYWQDVPFSYAPRSGAPINSHIWTLWCDTPNGWSTDDPLTPGGGVADTCWNNTIDAIGYIWTQNVPANDFLPTGSATTNLDVDMNSLPDSPPHTKLNYDLTTLEQITLQGVAQLDTRAGAQLAFDSMVDTAAGTGDLVSSARVISNVWLGSTDLRCFMGGDPGAVCAACTDHDMNGSLTCAGREAAGLPALACATDRDCQTYVGRCSTTEQPCDPASPTGATANHTACPGGSTCRSCVGVYSQGLCVGTATACRVDSDCAPGVECGDSAGNSIYPEPLLPNPLAIPVGYNTYGFPELELDTKCTDPVTIGRIGIVTEAPVTLAVPLAVISTTGKAAAEVTDPDISDSNPANDNAALGFVRGRCIAANSGCTAALTPWTCCSGVGAGTCNNFACSANSGCTNHGNVCNNIPALGIAAPGGGALSGGLFATGTSFPVDPSGGACCDTTGSVGDPIVYDPGGSQATIGANGAGISWSAGNRGILTRQGQIGTRGAILTRSGTWGPGANTTPGCPGDSSNNDGVGQQPDAGPCNDPFGVGISGNVARQGAGGVNQQCTAGDCDGICSVDGNACANDGGCVGGATPQFPNGADRCTNNTGYDDVKIRSRIGGLGHCEGPDVACTGVGTPMACCTGAGAVSCAAQSSPCTVNGNCQSNVCADIPVIAARAKIPNPAASGASAPTLYSVANLTGVDLHALPTGPRDTDFSATVEGVNCPMIGSCSISAADCILDGDCAGGGGVCQNRQKRCANPFAPADPCAALGGDADGDTICQNNDNCPGNANTNQTNSDADTLGDACDNCPTRTNQDQANLDGDALGNVCDACETIVNAGVDADADGVDNACDTCTNQPNPIVDANMDGVPDAPTTNRTLVSHQRDDDGDGRGNRCDFDYNQAGITIAVGDFNDAKFSLLPTAGLMTGNTCGATAAEGGSGATQQCGEMDHDGAGLSVAVADFNIAKAAFVAGGLITTNFPRCTACSIVGAAVPGGPVNPGFWSNTIAVGATLGRPVCESAVVGRCDYTP